MPPDVDLPLPFTIRERHHRIHNPFDDTKLAILGRALAPAAGTSVLDLACGSGELLCSWARDWRITGTGVDISTVFLANAHARARELDVADRVTFVHGDAAGHVADAPVGIAACLGASWIGGGLDGTVALLRRSLAPGGMLLLGEPYWRLEPPDQATVEGCHLSRKDDCRPLPELVGHFGTLGYDVVEMVLADQDSWDRYAAAQWLSVRRWLDAQPDERSDAVDHALVAELRAELDTAPVQHVRYQREYLGWGVFVLMPRCGDHADLG